MGDISCHTLLPAVLTNENVKNGQALVSKKKWHGLATFKYAQGEIEVMLVKVETLSPPHYVDLAWVGPIRTILVTSSKYGGRAWI